MGAGEYNFTLEQGATFRRDFIYKDADGDVVNLSGYSARMQVREHKDSGIIIIDATSANGKLAIDAPNGKISLLLTPADTNGIGFHTGVYDIEIEDGSGVVTRLIEGTITFSKQVTR